MKEMAGFNWALRRKDLGHVSGKEGTEGLLVKLVLVSKN